MFFLHHFKVKGEYIVLTYSLFCLYYSHKFIFIFVLYTMSSKSIRHRPLTPYQE